VIPIVLGRRPVDSVARIAILENEFEALALGTELEALDVPHAMVSYHDTALDGLFQVFQGWGHVEAPTQFRDEILTVLESMRRAQAQTASRAAGYDNPHGTEAGYEHSGLAMLRQLPQLAAFAIYLSIVLWLFSTVRPLCYSFISGPELFWVSIPLALSLCVVSERWLGRLPLNAPIRAYIFLSATMPLLSPLGRLLIRGHVADRLYQDILGSTFALLYLVVCPVFGVFLVFRDQSPRRHRLVLLLHVLVTCAWLFGDTYYEAFRHLGASR